MATERDDAVFPEEDIEDDDDSQEDDDDDELENDVVLPDDEEDLNSASPSTSSLPIAADPTSLVTVAVPGTSVFDGAPSSAPGPVSSSDPKLPAPEEKKPQPLPLDESRRLFQRLWTDEDEIELLQGFLDYTTQRGSSHHHDTALFYDQIKSKLQLDFNKNQLVEKLRRLKKKYRNVLVKINSGKDFSFKNPHDQATFEISRKIWNNTGRVGVEDNALDDDEESNPNPNPNPNPNLIYSEVKNEEIAGNSAEKKTPRSRKRARSRAGLGNEERPISNDGPATINGSNNNTNTATLIEDTVRSCLSPLFKELLSNAMGLGGPCTSRGFGASAFNPMALTFGGLGSLNFGAGEMVDEKWRKQHILELEVYSKRLELVQDQIKTALEELRSTGG